MLSFTHVQRLVRRATDPSGPSVYRDLYGLRSREPLEIASWEEWRRLRPITKDILSSYRTPEKRFLAPKDVDHIRATSGTSGKPPLYSLRTPPRGVGYHDAYFAKTRAVMAFTVPFMPHWHEERQAAAGKQKRVVAFDPQRPRASLRVAKAAGVDAFSFFTFHVTRVSPIAQEIGIAEDIRLVEVCGESCSGMLLAHIRRVFPNARILPLYGASEVDDAPVGWPCRALDDGEVRSVFHGKDTNLLELVDPDTGAGIEPRAGAEGDILVSAYPGEPCIPLVRYRIGDRVRVVEEACRAHGLWSFEVLGRSDTDFMKIEGGVLRADEVRRVLREMRLPEEFEMHRYEAPTDTGPRSRLELRIVCDGDAAGVADEFSTRFRVSPALTYAQGVASGLYAPLTVRPLEEVPQKRRSFVAHREDAKRH